MGPRHVAFLAQAIANRLGAPSSGAVAFLRCLPSEQIDVLADSDAFVVPGWTVNAVIDTAGSRRISADQAVEQREDKADAALLLVIRSARELVSTAFTAPVAKLARMSCSARR